MIRGRDQFKKNKPLINLLLKMCGFFPFNLKVKLLTFYRMTTGKKGLLIRYVLFKKLAKNCGDNISIHSGVYLFNVQNMSVGNNVSIHPMSYMDATGNIFIGNDVSIAHGVTIMSTTHNYDDQNIAIKDHPISLMSVTIMDNVWIGAKATILAGIKIESGCIIGATAVVTKDVPANFIVGGVPAKKISERL